MLSTEGFCLLSKRKGPSQHTVDNESLGQETSVHCPYERSRVTKFIRIQSKASAAKQIIISAQKVRRDY